MRLPLSLTSSFERPRKVPVMIALREDDREKAQPVYAVTPLVLLVSKQFTVEGKDQLEQI